MAEARLLTDGLHFAEGPRWHDGRLWFSDFYDHAIKSVGMDGDTRLEVAIPDGGQSSGLGWLPDGTLLYVSMLDRALKRVDGGDIAVHADLSGIATFHCNDMVVDAAGRAYVGNFGFDLDAALDERGVVDVLGNHATAALAIVEPDGSARVGTEGLHFPNGAVLTPDGSTLIVAETLAMRLTAFDVAANGDLSNGRLWADLGGRLPDGICLDADGAVWFANAGAAECVRVAEGGEVLDVVATTAPCFACMLGGPDGRTLFTLESAASHHREASAQRAGRILVSEVAAPGAGRP